MNDSIKLLVTLMVLWAAVVLIFNFLGQALSAAYTEDSSGGSISEMVSTKSILSGASSGPGQASAGHALQDGRDKMGESVLVDFVTTGQGFAFRANESVSLLLSIKKLRAIDPVEVRRLMNANIGIEELKEAIREQDADTVYSGEIRVGHNSYNLVNIIYTPTDGGQRIDADLADMQQGGGDEKPPNAIDGHLTLTNVDGNDTLKGVLTIRVRELNGTWGVLLQPDDSHPITGPEGVQPAS